MYPKLRSRPGLGKSFCTPKPATLAGDMAEPYCRRCAYQSRFPVESACGEGYTKRLSPIPLHLRPCAREFSRLSCSTASVDSVLVQQGHFLIADRALLSRLRAPDRQPPALLS